MKSLKILGGGGESFPPPPSSSKPTNLKSDNLKISYIFDFNFVSLQRNNTE